MLPDKITAPKDFILFGAVCAMKNEIYYLNWNITGNV